VEPAITLHTSLYAIHNFPTTLFGTRPYPPYMIVTALSLRVEGDLGGMRGHGMKMDFVHISTKAGLTV